MDVVLIPAYQPDQHLVELVEELKGRNYSILVVNDGSGSAYDSVFTQVEKHATIVSHKKNMGKGAALKTGMKYIRENIKECEHFITCDADGQHKPDDVDRVRDTLNKGEKFVLTVRKRRRKIPFKSKIGNNLSRFIYALLTNRYLPDNQSGLRGFSITHIDWLIEVEKDNYDYEMNVLYYAAKRGAKITPLLIDAIYIDNNQASHFNPITDTLKIYRSLFYLARGAFLSFILSEVLVLIASIWVGYDYIAVTIPVTAAFSVLTNMLLDRFWIFRKNRYNDYLNTIIYTIVHYFFYMLGCILIMYSLTGISLFLAFNICFLIGIPLRFYLHKAIYVATYTFD